MNVLIHKIKILHNSIIGILIKYWYYIIGLYGIVPLSRDHKHPEIIISLTSYGRRVYDTVYYTIISILRQSKCPNRIILWLDNSWNDSNLPNKLKGLKHFGVEIYYYHDIKSYKKLIPTLKITHEDIIITVDDDVIYNRDLIASLYNSYCLKPNVIHCTQALLPKQTSSHEFETYTNWDYADSSNNNDNELIFPIGVGAILYPPYTLHEDVLREDIFMTLCPNADDIWFWIMAKRNNIKHMVVDIKPRYYSFDAIYQLLHKNTALTQTNRKQNKNDDQLKVVIDYYKLHF